MSFRFPFRLHSVNSWRMTALLLALPFTTAWGAGTLHLDPSKSFVTVEVHVPMQSFQAHLERYEAQVTVDATGRVTAAQVSFRFGDLHSGNSERDAHMRSWLGGETATGSFVLEKLSPRANGAYQALGLLEINQVKQPVTFPVEMTVGSNHYQLTGQCRLDYRQWRLPLLARLGERVDPLLTVRFKLDGVRSAH